MTDPYAPHQHPQGPYAAQPGGPASGPDPYAQQQPGYYGGQPYGSTPPPAPQQPQQQTPPATPLYWGEPAAPSTSPWSGPSASAPPAPAAPPQAPQQPPAPQQHVQQQPPAPQQQPAAPAMPAAAPPATETPAQQPRSAAPDAPTASQPATDPNADSGDDALTIGRARSNSIVLDDMLVSRQHVRITADEEGLVLEDLGSRNGTYVNGRRVDRTHLHEGDHIGVGSSTFEVRDGWLVNV